MIRPATLDDSTAILDLAVASGLFPQEATGEVAEILQAGLLGQLGPNQVWLIDDDGGLIGVAYVAPERMTDGTWNMYMLAVHPDRQRQGHGAALVSRVEEEVADRDGRLLLVETSGVGGLLAHVCFITQLALKKRLGFATITSRAMTRLIFRKVIPTDLSSSIRRTKSGE